MNKWVNIENNTLRTLEMCSFCYKIIVSFDTINKEVFIMSIKIGINGFGRIGKLAFQAALEKRRCRSSSNK